MKSTKKFTASSLIAFLAVFALPTLAMGQAGSLDPNFGNNGIVTTANTAANAGALQSDGKIVVAGSITMQNSQLAGLLRYNTNGTLDSNFGTGGQVIIQEQRESGPVFAVAIQSDGKILAAGPDNLRLAVFRFNTNGTPDTTFGTNGVASVSTTGIFLAPANGGIVVQSDGKILVAGTSNSSAAQAFGRLLTNGQPDSTFGSNGVAPLVNGVQTLALLPNGLLPNGQIVVLSSGFFTGSASRYNTNGTLDIKFGVAGQAPGWGPAGGIAVLSSTSQFIVAGSLVTSPSLQPGGDISGFLVVRYNSNGTVDNTFGFHGGVATPFPGNVSSTALSVAIQSNGDIVAAGQTGASTGPSDFALARYTANGNIDTTFGNGGFVTTAFGSSAAVNTLLIQIDGKIVAVGNSSSGTTITRYLAE